MIPSQRLLDAAERLFAERGFAGTSLRSLTAAAGVNLAAVHYHFGSKEELIEAVFARRLGPLNRERAARLAACEAAGTGAPPLEAILEAFISPALQLSHEGGDGGRHFMRLLGRAYAEPDDHVRAILREHFDDTVHLFTAALQRVLPELPAEELFWRTHFALGSMGHLMACKERLESASKDAGRTSDSTAILGRLVVFLAAGMRAKAAPSRRAPAAPRLVRAGRGR